MSNQSEAVEQEINLFLSKVDELKHKDRKELLMAMFAKHAILNQSDIVLDSGDFDSIIKNASTLYVSQPLPVTISRKVLIPQESVNLTIIEATIAFLNSKGAIKRLPSFDRRTK